MSYWTQLTHERLYPPLRIAAVVSLLSDAGVAMEETLQGTGLTPSALREPGCRTSIAQYRQVCTRALALSNDASVPFRAGQRLRLSDHGLYGLVLMSCESIRECFMLAVKYQLLASPTALFDRDAGGGDEVRLWLDPTGPTTSTGLEVFMVEQALMQQLTHLGDAMGTPVRPTLARFAYPAPPHRALYERYFGCACVFDCERSGLQFDRDILARRPQLANPQAAATLQASCDGLVAEIEASLGFAGKVYRTLRQLGDPGAGMTAVATALRMTDRTLRRRLADEGTSFSDIAHQLRYGVAAEQLRHSDASIDQIACMAGFSDPANFRRAFIRWTRMTPAQFRRQNVT